MDVDHLHSPLTLLTDDLVFNILSFLIDAADRKSFRATSKAFYRLDSLSRTHLRLLRPDFLPSLLSNLPRVVSLDFSACPRVDETTIPYIVSSSAPIWTRIKRLTLSRCSGLRHHGLEMLMRNCVSLESVDVSYCCEFGDFEAAALSCAPGLRDLNLDKCLYVSDVGLAKIAVGCPNLQKLSVKWCFDISDIGIKLLCKKCTELNHLDISYLKVSSESLRWISGLERLEILTMVGCGSIDDVGLQFIGKGCPSLKSLDVSRCDQLSTTAFGLVIKGHKSLLQLHASYCFPDFPMAVVHQFKDLTKLNVLRINGACVSCSTLVIISETCRFLVEIGLRKCSITDRGIVQLVSGCFNLRVLDLTCCGDLTDDAILALSNSCKNLECLQLECCNLLTERSLDYLSSRCFLLREIDLTDCYGVNDIGLKYLSKCSELVSLKLGLCSSISDKGLSYIASNCIKIRELDLYRCGGIGDDGMAVISRGCKKLQKIILSYCTGITDRGIECLSSLKELSDLEMRCLQNITGTGLKKLSAGCRKLSELDLKNCENIDDLGFQALACYSMNLHQVNVSGTAISDVGLCMVLGNLTRIQDVKLLNLTNVSVSGLELALRASCQRLKKVKLPASIRQLVSAQVINILRHCGCKIRWD